jgi:F-type H+-transporting ATPase subunit c
MEEMYLVKAAAIIGAAFAISIGCIAPAYAQGLIGAEACKNIGKYPESSNKITTTMMIALGVVESSAVYCLMIAATLLFMFS